MNPFMMFNQMFGGQMPNQRVQKPQYRQHMGMPQSPFPGQSPFAGGLPFQVDPAARLQQGQNFNPLFGLPPNTPPPLPGMSPFQSPQTPMIPNAAPPPAAQPQPAPDFFNRVPNTREWEEDWLRQFMGGSQGYGLD